MDEDRHESKTFVEGIDFYFDDGLMVLTADTCSDRGYCCSNGCRHCPYGRFASEEKDLDLLDRTGCDSPRYWPGFVSRLSARTDIGARRPSP